MNYNETTTYLYNLPVFQKLGKSAYKSDIKNTKSLDAYFKYPHRRFKSIHIAGTNGKGSVASFLASVLQTAGYKTGLYTSPHLLDFRERIKVNGKLITENEVIWFVEKASAVIEQIQPSFFEVTTAMAFWYFAKQKVDIAIIETGLGGRLDSTNIIEPLLCIITNISYDHTGLLGDNLQTIAFEKAGIMKSHVPVVIGETQPEIKHVFVETANKKNAPLLFADQNYTICFKEKQNTFCLYTVYRHNELLFTKLRTDQTGHYQIKNIPPVLSAVALLNKQPGFENQVSKAHVLQGFANTKLLTGFKGRWYVMQEKPLIVCDTAHNACGIDETMKQLKTLNYNKLYIVFGLMNDKDTDAILGILPGDAKYFFCKPPMARALSEKELYRKAKAISLDATHCQSVEAAIQTCQKLLTPNDVVFIGGSTFVAAKAIEFQVGVQC